jgi:hypothetical protein
MILAIDPEFRDLIPRLSKDEYAGLEASIKEYGCHTAITTWNNLVIDGHNRFEICTKYGIDFAVNEWEFDDRRDARIWILDNQLSRRNITEVTRMDMVLLLKAEVQAQAQERSAANLKRGIEIPEGPKSEPRGKTDATLAAKAGVGKTKLREYETVVKTAAPELLQAVRSSQVSVHTAAQAAKTLTREEQIEVLAKDPGKVGEVVRKEIARKKEIDEANAEVRELNAKHQPASFDPEKERARMQLESKLYRAISAVMELPTPAETLAAVSSQCEYRLNDLEPALTWLNEFQQLYKEKHDEAMATVA